MKFYYQRPTREIRIVKPDRDDAEYEFWVLTPVRIGSARKTGTQQIQAEDGNRFVNLQSAAIHFLEQHEAEAGAGRPPKVVQPPKVERVQINGMAIVAKGKWAEFCQMRKLNLTAIEHVAKDYHLTNEELAQLGLAVEGMQ